MGKAKLMEFKKVTHLVNGEASIQTQTGILIIHGSFSKYLLTSHFLLGTGSRDKTLNKTCDFFLMALLDKQEGQKTQQKHTCESILTNRGAGYIEKQKEL